MKIRLFREGCLLWIFRGSSVIGGGRWAYVPTTILRPLVIVRRWIQYAETGA